MIYHLTISNHIPLMFRCKHHTHAPFNLVTSGVKYAHICISDVHK